MTKILKVVGASWLRTKISSYILGIIGVLAIVALFVGQFDRIQEDGNYAATVFYSNKTGYRIEYWGQSNDLSDIPKGVARAHFRMDIDTTGWSLLEVETDSSYPDEIQAYAAGIVEGALTWYLIHTHLENTIRARCEDQEKQCDKLRDALDRSVNIWKTKSSERAAAEPFWHQVSLHYTQISGIYTGWKHGVDRSMKEYDHDISDLHWLNAVAETVEFQRKMNLTLRDPALDAVSGLSSAFLRIVNETSEDGTAATKLYVAHNAAGSYSSMTRILKRYKLNYHLTSKSSTLVSGTTVEFSGYPGSVTSQDEFYMVQGAGHSMAVTGTSLNNYNSHLWKDVNITVQIPTAPRVATANRLASNPSAWAHILAVSNSGTASKQWLVVDFTALGHLDDSGKKADRKEFVPMTGLNQDVRHISVIRNSTGHQKGLLRLIEQVPGRTHSADLTETLLEQGFWATYGLPFFEDISEHTHVKRMKEEYGEIFSEFLSPRAVMFKRGYKNATSLDSIIALMRQNNVTAMNRASNETVDCTGNDPCILQDKGYWSVLGVRGDIAHYREAYGVIDTKVVVGQANHRSLQFVAISSPPYSNSTTNTSIPLNKGTVATIYTDQFDDEPTINGPEIRDLVKKQLEEEAQETLERLNRDVIKPFQWSESEFQNNTHQGLPDTWNFGSFTPVWSW
ncbi:putative phospholipase B-like lamina ancestor [Cydia splendana]|uniref:putative phospholipase B-like lamina ancestor n=1 Tax=Cydia splendana TaxID=1100963 RepID=UPI00214713D1